MKRQWKAHLLLALKLYLLSLLLAPLLDSAMALDEIFEIYNSPQGLAMGNAYTADATGHSANYYNPAGLAKNPKKLWEIIPIAIDAIPGLDGAQRAVGAKSLGLHQVAREMRNHPGQYYYDRFNFMPAASYRNFAVTLLGSYQNAGVSDGTNFDTFATTDLGVTVGYGVNLAGNLVKIGVAAKALVRNELKGTFAHDDIDSEIDIKQRSHEGLGYGGDIGMLFTLPNRYLPTLGVSWRDVLNTRFQTPTRVLNSEASGTPSDIRQSFNVAMSMHPYFRGRWRGTASVEYKHIELGNLPFRKHFHVGFQLEDSRQWFFWAGLNQLYWTAGVGLRVRGGNLEIGTYGQDIGSGQESKEDRRVLFRYTIGL